MQRNPVSLPFLGAQDSFPKKAKLLQCNPFISKSLLRNVCSQQFLDITFFKKRGDAATLERANNGGGVARVPRNNGNRAQLSRVSQGNPVIIRSFSTPKKALCAVKCDRSTTTSRIAYCP